MKKFTMLFSLMAMAMIFSLNISAQRPGGGQGGGPGRGMNMTEEDVKERVDNMAETLGLSADQHKKVEKMELDYYNKMQVERQKRMNTGQRPSEEERNAMREQMTKMRDARDAKYKEILNEDQYTQWKELQEQRRNERPQRPEGGDNSGRSSRGRG